MNIGDRVVCIRADKGFDSLTIGKEYNIINIAEDSGMYSSTGIYIDVRNDRGFIRSYYYSKFISIKEYRKQKLDKINLVYEDSISVT